MARALRLPNLLWSSLWLLCCSGGAAQAAGPVEEPDLKAAYVFNFIQFVEWPDSATAPEGEWPVCVSPFSPLKRALAALEGRPVRKGRVLRVRLLEPGDLRQCRVLILNGPETEPALRALRALPAGHGILTVADEGVADHPDIAIALGRQAQRIVFAVNTDAAGRAGLTVSSRLLRLAKAAP